MLIVGEIPSRSRPGSRVIDLGTGTGRHAIFLAERGYEVDAIDASPRAIAELRSLLAGSGLPIQAEVRDACSTDIDFTRYSVVICTFVLHFLPAARASALLARARAEAPPGTLHAISVITAQGEFLGLSVEGQFYPEPGEVADEYRAAGWTVHHAWDAEIDAKAKRADGSAMRNVVSFLLAGS